MRRLFALRKSGWVFSSVTHPKPLPQPFGGAGREGMQSTALALREVEKKWEMLKVENVKKYYALVHIPAGAGRI